MYDWGEEWVIDIPYIHLLLKYPHLAPDIPKHPHRWCVECEGLYALCTCVSNRSSKKYPLINVTQLKE